MPVETLRRADIKSEKLTTGWDKIVEAFELDADVVLDLKHLRELREQFVEKPTTYGAGSLEPGELKDEHERALLEAVMESVRPEKEAVTEDKPQRIVLPEEELEDSSLYEEKKGLWRLDRGT